jgi:hypothetical protein
MSLSCTDWGLRWMLGCSSVHPVAPRLRSQRPFRLPLFRHQRRLCLQRLLRPRLRLLLERGASPIAQVVESLEKPLKAIVRRQAILIK